MMPNITKEYFLNLFDEFSKVKPDRIAIYIGLATIRVPLSVWCENTPYATALLTAHMLTTSGRQGLGSAGGAVSQEAVGDLSRSFAQCFDPTAGDAVLRVTRYGIDFVALRKETFTTAMTTRGAVPIPIRRCW
jgi:hypothetical protein